MQRILHLVRHGQIDLRTRPSTRQGWSLTALGREQAMLTARRLSSLPIAGIHCSTYPRALETAQIVAAACGGLDIRPSPSLCECVPGIPQRFRDWHATTGIQPPDQDQHDVPIEMRPWLNLWTHYVDFEAVAAGEAQGQTVFETYFGSADAEIVHEVIVSHGNLLGYLLCRVLDLPSDTWMQWDMSNCAISEVRIDSSGAMRLLSFNDTGHLPYEMRTDNEHSLW